MSYSKTASLVRSWSVLTREEQGACTVNLRKQKPALYPQMMMLLVVFVTQRLVQIEMKKMEGCQL